MSFAVADSLGGDSDTLACITGGLAEAYYQEIPEEIARQMWSRLPDEFREILREMERKVQVSVGRFVGRRWKGKGKVVVLRGRNHLIYGAIKEVITRCKPYPAKRKGS